MLKIHISQQFEGRSRKEIIEERNEIERFVMRWFGRCYKGDAKSYHINNIYIPFDPENENDWYHLSMLTSRMRRGLAEADICMFAPGWEKARGCRIERMIAAEYDKGVMYLCRDAKGELAEASVEPYTSESDDDEGDDEGEKCAAAELLERIVDYAFAKLPLYYEKMSNADLEPAEIKMARAASYELEHIMAMYGCKFEYDFGERDTLRSVYVNNEEFWQRKDLWKQS